MQACVVDGCNKCIYLLHRNSMELLLFCKEYPEDDLSKALILRNSFWNNDGMTKEEKDVFKVVASFVIRHMRKCSMTVGTSLHRILKAFKTHCFVEGIHVSAMTEKIFHNSLLRLGMYAKLRGKTDTIYYGFFVCEEYDFYCK
jgi:hypothetical protein